MPRNTQYYSQADHSVVIKGSGGETFTHQATDFADGDDAISVERLGERIALTQGFDSSSISFASTDGGQVTLKLKPTSPTVGFLNGLFNRSKSTPTLVELTISTGVKDVVTLTGAGIDQEGFSTGGPTMQPRTFIFIGKKINFDEDTTL